VSISRSAQSTVVFDRGKVRYRTAATGPLKPPSAKAVKGVTTPHSPRESTHMAIWTGVLGTDMGGKNPLPVTTTLELTGRSSLGVTLS